MSIDTLTNPDAKTMPHDIGQSSTEDRSDHRQLPHERKDAAETGSKFYFTGRPCKNGHYAPRNTISGACTSCAVKAVSEDRKKKRDMMARSIAKKALEAEFAAQLDAISTTSAKNNSRALESPRHGQ